VAQQWKGGYAYNLLGFLLFYILTGNQSLSYRRLNFRCGVGVYHPDGIRVSLQHCHSDYHRKPAYQTPARASLENAQNCSLSSYSTRRYRILYVRGTLSSQLLDSGLNANIARAMCVLHVIAAAVQHVRCPFYCNTSCSYSPLIIGSKRRHCRENLFLLCIYSPVRSFHALQTHIWTHPEHSVSGMLTARFILHIRSVSDIDIMVSGVPYEDQTAIESMRFNTSGMTGSSERDSV